MPVGPSRSPGEAQSTPSIVDGTTDTCIDEAAWSARVAEMGRDAAIRKLKEEWALWHHLTTFTDPVTHTAATIKWEANGVEPDAVDVMHNGIPFDPTDRHALLERTMMSHPPSAGSVHLADHDDVYITFRVVWVCGGERVACDSDGPGPKECWMSLDRVMDIQHTSVYVLAMYLCHAKCPLYTHASVLAFYAL